jgi:hypothetical protein
MDKVNPGLGRDLLFTGTLIIMILMMTQNIVSIKIEKQ